MPSRTAGLLLLAWAATTAGQQAPPDPPPIAPRPVHPILTQTAASPPLTAPSVVLSPVIEPPQPSGPPVTVAESLLSPGLAIGQQHSLGLQVQFGYPTGLRVQYALFHGGDYSILAEAFGGARSAFWGEEGVIGVGGRVQFNIASDGAKNALIVGPGVGLSYWQTKDRSYAVYEPWSGTTYEYRGQTDRWFLTLDTNIGWVHELSPALAWEIGLNVGVRVGLSGEEHGGETISGKVSGGNVGVYTGFRY